MEMVANKELETDIEKKDEDNQDQTPSLGKEATIEGLLYVAGEDGIKAARIAETLDITLEDTCVYLENIKKRYRDDSFGIELVDYGGTYKFLTKREIAPYVQKLLDLTRSSNLSQSALETLAIIAYKQPITRVEIEDLRGVGYDMMLRKLLARGLIQESGRSQAPGRPILYEVTDEFMDSFKLESLSDLPILPDYSTDEESESLFSE